MQRLFDVLRTFQYGPSFTRCGNFATCVHFHFPLSVFFHFLLLPYVFLFALFVLSFMPQGGRTLFELPCLVSYAVTAQSFQRQLWLRFLVYMFHLLFSMIRLQNILFHFHPKLIELYHASCHSEFYLASPSWSVQIHRDSFHHSFLWCHTYR
jgi:hypothetical protein